MRCWSVRLPRAQAIVSSDRHLLELKIYQGIPILTASELSPHHANRTERAVIAAIGLAKYEVLHMLKCA